MDKQSMKRASSAGLLIALGIIYGDIGTSPLYVFNSIINEKVITNELIIGALSCIIWTITLQTTLKYVLLILKADNRGEGGIFALYALVRRRKKWLVVPAMIGGAALLADGIITPPISITSAVEGLQKIPVFKDITSQTIVLIVVGILVVFFFMQQFGTASIGKLFGPVMFLWFCMLAVLGAIHLADDVTIFKAVNPYYAIDFLLNYPGGFWLLGAVFLCSTGAEALYSDLGHCGRPNIRVSWIFVKTCLVLNYFGQGAYLLAHRKGVLVDKAAKELLHINSFFDLMPHWFVLAGVVIATAAAIIASQALISGSFTLISEAIRLNLWPRLKIRYSSEAKGQLFIPGTNFLLFMGCLGAVLYFRESARMEAAYGLAIIMTMLSTTILFSNYLVLHRVNKGIIWLFLVGYLFVESAFLVSLLQKFTHGGYVTLIIALVMFVVMFVWFKSRKIKNRYVEFVRLENYVPQMQELSNDRSIPKYATHLVYLTSANNPKEIEHKIIYSILNRKPKRADIFWFIHVDTLDDPYTCEYKVDHIIPNDIIRVEFRLGFRIEPRINLLFRKVIEDLVANKEVNITSRYESLEKNNVVADISVWWWLFIGYVFLMVLLYFVQDRFFFKPEKLPLDFVYKYNAPFKEINFDIEPGVRINGLHFYMEKPHGLILYFHGNSRSVKGWGKYAVDFFRYGYDVVLVDYRGFGKSTGKRSEEDMLSDMQFVYESLTQNMPESHIIVYGRSMGSGFACKIASNNSPRFLILDAPYFSFVKVVKRFLPIMPANWVLRYHLRTDKWILKVRCHTYIIHGTKDLLIPFKQSIQLQKLSPSRITLIRIHGGGHNNLPSFPEYHAFLRSILLT